MRVKTVELMIQAHFIKKRKDIECQSEALKVERGLPTDLARARIYKDQAKIERSIIIIINLFIVD